MTERIELAEISIAVDGHTAFTGYFYRDADAWLRARNLRFVGVTVIWADGSRHAIPRVDLGEQPDAPLAELLRTYVVRSAGMDAPPGVRLDTWRQHLARFDPSGAMQRQMVADLMRLSYDDVVPVVIGRHLVPTYSDGAPRLSLAGKWQADGLDVIVSRQGSTWAGWAYSGGGLVASTAGATPGQVAAALNEQLRSVVAAGEYLR